MNTAKLSFNKACMAFLIALIRQRLILFSDALCRTLDDMMDGGATPSQIRQEESIFYKINHRLIRLYEVMHENRRSIAKERAALLYTAFSIYR